MTFRFVNMYYCSLNRSRSCPVKFLKRYNPERIYAQAYDNQTHPSPIRRGEDIAKHSRIQTLSNRSGNIHTTTGD